MKMMQKVRNSSAFDSRQEETQDSCVLNSCSYTHAKLLAFYCLTDLHHCLL